MAIVNIKNQTLSKTNIQESDSSIQLQSNIEIYNILEDGTTKQYVIPYYYKIIVNDYNSGIYTSDINPGDITVTIPTDSFILGDNNLSLIILDQDQITELFRWEYNIIKEDRDTFTLQRRFQYDSSPEISGNVILKSGEGFTLSNNIGSGEIKLELYTDGKDKIESILVSSTDNNTEQNYVIENTTLVSMDIANAIYSTKINKSKYSSISIIEIN